MKINKTTVTIEYEDGTTEKAVFPPESETVYKITKNEVKEVKETEAIINFVTEVPTQAYIQYMVKGSDEVLVGDKEESFNYSDHTQTLRNLKPDTDYRYTVYTNDEQGNEVISETKEFSTLGAIVVPPTTPNDGYVMLNVINWDDMSDIPVESTSECTYFVMEVNSDGSFVTVNNVQQRDFVAQVEDKGGVPTFSIAGGSQSVGDITHAVVKNPDALVKSIKDHMDEYRYAGVTLDIEHTSIPSANMGRFIGKLRKALGDDAIIGAYTQPFQRNTVWAELEDIAPDLTWLSAMHYDAGVNDVDRVMAEAKLWEGVGKDKLLVGVAVNYPEHLGGLTPAQYHEVVRQAKDLNYKGIAVWQNILFTPEYR